MTPLLDPANPTHLRFEVIYDGEGDPKVYGVAVPYDWPLQADFPADAPRFFVPVNEIKFKADHHEADKLTIVALLSQVRLVGQCGPLGGGEQKPVEIRARGAFPKLEVLQDGYPRRDVKSVLWQWDAHDRRAKVLIGALEKGVADG